MYCTVTIVELILVAFIADCYCKENNLFSDQAVYKYFIDEDLFFEIIHPKELQYTYRLRQARNFGSKFKSPLQAVRLVLCDPVDCCSRPYNDIQVKGAVVLVLRGYCSFLSKAITAEKAGSYAIIIMDNNIDNDNVYIEMIDDNTNRQANIPAVFLLGRSGYIIQNKLKQLKDEAVIINIPVNVSNIPIHKVNQPPWVLW